MRFADHLCRMQQGLGWDAAFIQAHATQRRAGIDHHNFAPQIGSTKSAGIATGASADDHQVSMVTHVIFL